MGEAYRNLLRRKATEKYPAGGKAGVALPEGFRGKVSLKLELCIGCSLCEKDCPASAITIIPDERCSKKKRPEFFLDRCMFCGQCEYTCPTHAIYYSKEFENAAYDRKSLEMRDIP